MKIAWIIIFNLIFINFLFGQKQNNIWVFGNHAGFDFNSGIAGSLDSTAVASVDNHSVYTSAISDKYGELLFYTDGFTTWNRKHKAMPKFEYRWPWTGFIMPLICPVPENDSLFYIFGVSDGSYANRLQCITINMKGNDEYGEIVYPDPPVTSSNYYKLLLENASVFVAGTAHCNRRDQWIVTFAEDAFYSFLVNPAGINTVPVISPVPSEIMKKGIYKGGNIKFSASGERMVVPLLDENKIVLLDFDNFNGTFSNPLKISVPDNQYITDVELSPDGSKLYVSLVEYDEYPRQGQEYHTIAQMDIANWNRTDIEGSFFSFDNFNPLTANFCTPHNCYVVDRSMQLGPDGRIYISMREVTETTRDKTVSVIEEPNLRGLDARYTKAKFSLKRQYKYIKYNYIRSASFSPQKNGIQFKRNICADAPVAFNLLLNKVDSVKWNFGDSLAGTANFSTEFHPQHTYPAPGKYTVKAIIFNKCFADTADAEVTITTDKQIKIPGVVKDSVICTGTTLFMDATTPGASKYLWGGGNISPVQKITVAGNYEIQVQNDCSIDRRTFKISIEDCKCDVFVPNAFSPNYDGLNDFFKPVVKCLAADFQFSVFDKYGQTIFESKDYSGNGWNGNVKAEPAAVGAYVWLMQYRNPNTKKMITQKGTVYLLR
jgi:gliding motility-associated-like protein